MMKHFNLGSRFLSSALLSGVLLFGGSTVVNVAFGAPAQGSKKKKKRKKATSVKQRAEGARDRLENGMAELGRLKKAATDDGKMAKVVFIMELEREARDILRLATSELLIVRDRKSDRSARLFALAKLEEASKRMDKLVEKASQYEEESSDPDNEGELSKTRSKEPETIPVKDPTGTLNALPTVPPAVDGDWPAAASPIE